MSNKDAIMANERHFLNRIGLWSKHPGKPEGLNMPKRTLLMRYRDTMHLRNNWGPINPEKVRDHLAMLIAKET